MTIFLRCDTGASYGLGHATRCRTLACALQVQAPEIPLVFVTTTSVLEEVVHAASTGWRVQVCGESGAAHWLHWVKAQAQPGDVLIIDMPDHQNGALWATHIRDKVTVVRLDAPWATPETCDLLVLPGMHHAPETVERLDAAFGERLLVGADYVMLQEGVPQVRRPFTEHNQRIVFAAGGSDPDQALPLLYEMAHSLSDLIRAPLRVFCVGAMAEPWTLRPPDMRERITGFSLNEVAYAALFVTLWGTTVYEALAMGTPTLTIARTERDAEGAARLEAATEGAVQPLGTLGGLMRETLCYRLVDLWQERAQRKRMHYASAGLLDGHGAERVAAAVLGLREKEKPCCPV